MRLAFQENPRKLLGNLVKILLAYCVSPALNSEWAATIEVQKHFPLPSNCVQRRFYSPDCGEEENFNKAKCQNLAIEYAIEEGADWILMMDSTGVLINEILEFPESGYATAWVFAAPPGQTNPDLREGSEWCGFGCKSRWSPVNSLFLLGRTVFTRVRFCEDYIGFGYQDIDFKDNVIDAAGIKEGWTNARLMHLFHPRHNLYHTNYLRNQELYSRRLTKTAHVASGKISGSHRHLFC